MMERFLPLDNFVIIGPAITAYYRAMFCPGLCERGAPHFAANPLLCSPWLTN